MEELVAAIADSVPADERAEMARLVGLGLPPITSRDVLAVMLGVNAGLLWSFEQSPSKHYRTFSIPKGAGRQRAIVAPRVGLKILQKWLSVQIQKRYRAPPHVFGFVQGRSHIDAANCHRQSRWVYSVDIRDFFPATPLSAVSQALGAIGYGVATAEMLARMLCFRGHLAQGAPSSPVLSNLAFSSIDAQLHDVATRFGLRLSRYADDVVFSGQGDFPNELADVVASLLDNSPWAWAPEKTEFLQLPDRLKVHGLLVHGEAARLTKGYRNKIRAYTHLLKTGRVREDDSGRLKGHVNYGSQVLAAK